MAKLLCDEGVGEGEGQTRKGEKIESESRKGKRFEKWISVVERET